MTPPNDVAEAYHRWYYDTRVWFTTKWHGILVQKSVSDLWNYQEILSELRPRLIIEFGTYSGGSALYFADMLRSLGIDGRVFSVDVDHTPLALSVRSIPTIELHLGSSADPAVAARCRALREEFPGPVFAIVDSDHSKGHVLAELRLLRDVLVAGDYLIVEDSNVNGHPVLPDFGEGPFEAIAEYEAEHPDDYEHDLVRENKFGFTFAPRGFLIRK